MPLTTNSIPETIITPPGQLNPRKAWVYALGYWSVGAIIGYHGNYFKLINVQTSYIPQYASILALTIETGRVMNTRHTNYGRKQNHLANIFFALANGIFETVIFLFVQETGEYIIFMIAEDTLFGSLASPLSWSTSVIGFLFFSFFSALIHVLFWLKLVFPPTERENLPPFHTNALPALVTMSASWIWIYKQTNDIVCPCLMHILLDYMAMKQIAMFGPFDEKIAPFRISEHQQVNPENDERVAPTNHDAANHSTTDTKNVTVKVGSDRRIKDSTFFSSPRKRHSAPLPPRTANSLLKSKEKHIKKEKPNNDDNLSMSWFDVTASFMSTE